MYLFLLWKLVVIRVILYNIVLVLVFGFGDVYEGLNRIEEVERKVLYLLNELNL